MVLELIERVLAALIILGLLVIVLFLAFPDRNNGWEFSSRTEQKESRPRQAQPKPERQVVVPDPTAKARPEETLQPQRQTSPKQAELAKSDSAAFSKTVAQLPDSHDNQEAIYYRAQRTTPNPTRKRYFYRDRYSPSSTPYVKKVHYYDPWRRVDHYDCVGESCWCSCDEPYWASGTSICWD